MQKNHIKAVILAAGLGNRMVQTKDPKSSLNIGPFSHKETHEISLIERQIRLLKLFGVHQICVVVGYRKELLTDLLEKQEVFFAENNETDLSKSGSLHSFQFAVRSGFNPLDGKSNTLLMDADIVYEARVLEEFLDQLSGSDSQALISPTISENTEEVTIYGKNNRPCLIGKGLKGEITGTLNCLGEACGIVHFAPGDHPLAHSFCNWLLGDPEAPEGSDERRGFGPAKKNTEHEELTQRLILLDRISCAFIPKNSLFMEVDFETEYLECRNEFYPKVLSRDHEIYPRFF